MILVQLLQAVAAAQAALHPADDISAPTFRLLSQSFLPKPLLNFLVCFLGGSLFVVVDCVWFGAFDEAFPHCPNSARASGSIKLMWCVLLGCYLFVVVWFGLVWLLLTKSSPHRLRFN